MRLKTLRVTEGETVLVTNPWEGETEARNTMISGSSWSYDGEGTVGTAALSGTDATVLLTPETGGVLSNTVLLANGETLVAERQVEIA